MDKGMIPARLRELIASQLGCLASEIRMESRLYHDLKISGDDARDMLEKIAREFSISFDDEFNVNKRFPTEQDEVSALFWVKKKLGRGEEYVPTTLEDLARYVSQKVIGRS